MITKKEISEFIDKIPPTPEILKETLSLLNNGELTKAASVAESDLALKSYLKSIVNNPIYGFRNEVNDISQIFGILGVCRSQQTVHNYMINLLSPKEWLLFNLTENTFLELQAHLSTKWEKILQHLSDEGKVSINDKDVLNAISLLPSSIIVTEALFSTHIKNVKLLKETKALDYNTILLRLCGITLFDICEEIAKKWDMHEIIPKILQASSGINQPEDEKINQLGKWMHLLLFYELSQPQLVKAGLNDFIDFHVDYVEDIYEEFISMMEIS